MSFFFLLLEIFIYGYGIYIFWEKRELGFIHLPVLFFAFAALTPILPVQVFYGFVTLLLLFIIKKNYNLLQENPFSILLFAYFLILLFQASATIKLGLTYFGLDGVAYAVCIHYTTSRLTFHYYMKKYIYVTDLEVMQALKKPGIAALLMLATIGAVTELNVPTAPTLLLGGGAGAAVYALFFRSELMHGYKLVYKK